MDGQVDIRLWRDERGVARGCALVEGGVGDVSQSFVDLQGDDAEDLLARFEDDMTFASTTAVLTSGHRFTLDDMVRHRAALETATGLAA